MQTLKPLRYFHLPCAKTFTTRLKPYTFVPKNASSVYPNSVKSRHNNGPRGAHLRMDAQSKACYS
jgi:hypothetical protein